MSDEQLQDDLQNTQNAADTTLSEEASALLKAQQEVLDIKDQMLRTQAEMQNVRRRAEADVEKAHKFGVEKFANEMLAVVDNLERAVAACDAKDEASRALREGVEMTLTGMLSALGKFKVDVVNPLNEVFNPELHQAITMVDNPDAAPNTVIAVMQKGYTLQGRLMRPAMVVVSKSAPSVNTKA